MFHIVYNGTETCQLHTTDREEARKLAARFVASYERWGGVVSGWKLEWVE